MLKKMQAFALAVLLLVIADFAAIYGFFYFCVFDVPAGDEIAHLGAKYAGAVVLDGCDLEQNRFRYLLVEMSSGETQVLALQQSNSFRGRYHLAPANVLEIPKERPSRAVFRATFGTAVVWVQTDNSLRVRRFTQNYEGTNAAEGALIPLIAVALLAAEFALWLLIVRLRNGPAPTLPVKESPALQQAGMPPPALDRHSLRSGPGHPAQRIPAKSILKPIARLLLLGAAGFISIYLIFSTFVLTIKFDGDLASLGPEYENAVDLDPDEKHYYPDMPRYTYLVRTDSGEMQLLFLKYSVFHRDRYQIDSVPIPEDLPYSFHYSGLGLDTYVEISSDFHVALLSGPDGTTLDGSSEMEDLELFLYGGWLLFIWGLAVFASRRIEPPKDGEKKD